MKKISCFALIFCLLLSLCPAVSAEGTSWSISDDGTLTISGSGAMEDYDIGSVPWARERESISAVVVEPGVTHIGNYAFRMLTNLESVSLPEGLESIGDYAFNQCRKLPALDIPDSVQSIGRSAFDACWALESLELPALVTEIAPYCFARSGIKSMDLEGVRSIGDGAFSQCVDLHDLTVPASVESIGDYAFGASGLKDIHFLGAAPEISGQPFGYRLNEYVDGSVTATAHYPAAEQSWTEALRAAFGGNVTWLAEGFADVPGGAWYFEAVNWALNAGITSGTGQGLFEPERGCTRAQIVTFLWRAAGCPEPVSTENPFTDVHQSDYFYKAVLWATENGVTTGISDGKFAPDAGCTRAQAVTFLHRFAGCPEAENNSAFSDVPTDAYYAAAVAWAFETGISTGVSEFYFEPNESCSRAQIVTFLYRYMK